LFTNAVKSSPPPIHITTSRDDKDGKMCEFTWTDDFTESLDHPGNSYYRYEKWRFARRVKISVPFLRAYFGLHIREVLIFGSGKLLSAVPMLYFILFENFKCFAFSVYE